MEQWHVVLLLIGVQVIIGLFITIIGYLIKRSIVQIDRRLESGDIKFKQICDDIVELKTARGFDREYFSKEYVAKDDFIRDVRALDFKIDGVHSDVKEVHLKIDDIHSEIKELLLVIGKEKSRAEV
jgi:hypothetical protein